ncbi:MAG: glutathione S-transferase family protein [Gammaproteobacteria bacterium]
MAELKLVIGSKTYSSWSLRPWLLLRYHNVAFREIPIALNQPDTRKRIAEYSPTGKVPVLLNGPEKVWESLAICEYAAETLKLPAAWPSDVTLRNQARSLACEMHAGFADLRRELPMDCRRAPSPKPYGPAAAADIARIRQIWRTCRQANAKSGDWLFGKFGIVDAMFAPVVMRLHAYAVPVDGPEKDYMHTVLHLPALREWLGAAMLENVAPPDDVAAAAAPAAAPADRNSVTGSHKAVPPPAAPRKEKTAAAPPPPPPPPPPPAAAPATSADPKAGAKVVSTQGGVRVISNIIPD